MFVFIYIYTRARRTVHMPRHAIYNVRETILAYSQANLLNFSEIRLTICRILIKKAISLTFLNTLFGFINIPLQPHQLTETEQSSNNPAQHPNPTTTIRKARDVGVSPATT